MTLSTNYSLVRISGIDFKDCYMTPKITSESDISPSFVGFFRRFHMLNNLPFHMKFHLVFIINI